MRIVVVHPVPSRRWHEELAAALRTAGHDVQLVAGRHQGRTGLSLDVALAVERRVLRMSTTWAARCRLPPQEAPAPPYDLHVVLDGSGPAGGLTLEPCLDGVPCDVGLVAMLAPRGTRGFALRATREGTTATLLDTVLAIEEPDVASRAIDRTLRRIVALIVHGVRLIEGVPSPATPSEDAPASQTGAGLPAFFQRLARKLWRRLRGIRMRDDWAIGFRPTQAGSPACGPAAYTMLVDDGLRFCADPIPFVKDGRTVLFFEDFPYATRKGVIGAVDIAPDGSVSPPHTVLELPHHLSYPFVFAHAGEVYMLPEATQARRIELFRAAPFPDVWVSDRILVDDVVASDATPVFFEGRWWMFATLSDDGGSSWDQLGLFHAPDLLGPWTAHAGNPVLVDAGSARPGGAMWVEAGHLMRVAQDCRTGYGRGLVICRVDVLTERAFAQTIVARIHPPPQDGADGIHTLSRTDRWEFIDLHFSGACRRCRSAVPPAPGRG